VRRLETVRRDFVANVSHELRTPLTIVSGFAETLQDASLPVEDRGRFVATILANTQRMQRIVDDLLDLSRIESGGWRPNPTHVDLKAAVQEVFDSVRPVAEQKGLALVPAIPADVPSVYADPTALVQCSATWWTTPCATPRPAASRSPPGARTEVSHSPCATLGRELARSTCRASSNASTGSMPPALATRGGLEWGWRSKHMVEAHGGRKRAESAANVGTTVALYLPDWATSAKASSRLLSTRPSPRPAPPQDSSAAT
jgi:hypothetical protein